MLLWLVFFAFTILFLRFHLCWCAWFKFIHSHCLKYFVEWKYHNYLFSCWWTFSCFQFLQLTKNVNIDVLLQFSLCTHVRDSQEYLHMSDIAGLKGIWIFSYTKYCPIVSRSRIHLDAHLNWLNSHCSALLPTVGIVRLFHLSVSWVIYSSLLFWISLITGEDGHLILSY